MVLGNYLCLGVWESAILLDTSESITCKRPFNDCQNAIFSKWHSLPLAHLQTRRNTSKNIGHTEQKTNGESFLLTPSPAMPLRFALDLRHQAWPLKKIPAQSKGIVTKFSLAVNELLPYLV